ncbi:MAG: PEGA domain-containing protein [Nannocystales bacterium]
MFVAFSIAGALFAGTPEVELRVVESEAPAETVSALSDSAVVGIEGSGRVVQIGAGWREDCAADACFREAMSSTSASAVVLLTVDQQDNVYRFALEARSAATGERLGSVDDVCEICGLEEVAELVELRAAALGERLERPEEGIVRITSDPPGATVMVDDRAVGATPLELTLSAGPHAVRVEKPGFLEDAKAVDVRAGVDEEMRFRLVVVPTKDRSARRWLTVGGVSLGLGLAGLAAGIPLVIMDGRPYKTDCRPDPMGNCAQLFGTVAAGASLTTAGVIGVGAGAAMLLIGRKRRSLPMEVRPTAGGIAGRF